MLTFLKAVHDVYVRGLGYTLCVYQKKACSSDVGRVSHINQIFASHSDRIFRIPVGWLQLGTESPFLSDGNIGIKNNKK